MADFLVQRYAPNVPNETEGGWVDVAIVRDLKADEADKALDQLPPTTMVDRPLEGPIRVSRWDMVEQREATLTSMYAKINTPDVDALLAKAKGAHITGDRP